MNEPDFINNRQQLREAVEAAKDVIDDVFAEYKELTGREYRKVDTYKTEDADVIIFAAGSVVPTYMEACDRFREQGYKVGIAGIMALRPWPEKELVETFKNAKLVVSMDRQDSYSALGGSLTTELKATFNDNEINAKVISRVYGLSGRPTPLEKAEEIIQLGIDAFEGKDIKKFDYYGVDIIEGGKLVDGLPPLTLEQQTSDIKTEMGEDGKVKVSGVNLRKLMKKEERITPGHGACVGCGIFPTINQFLLGIEGHVVMLVHTGCAMVVSAGYPYTSFRSSYIHNLFQNGAATMSGVVEAFDVLKDRGIIPKDEEITFIMVTGDGGNDIGMGPTVGAANRNHRMIILEYDNEGYMNTGNQLSYSTPLGHRTSTSNVGPAQQGKTFQHKDTAQIMAGCHMPYIFTASEAFPMDTIKKAAKAQYYVRNYGTVYGKMLSACPLNWRHDDSEGTKVIKAATDCNFFPLYEIEKGITTLTYNPDAKNKKIPLVEWLGMMGKTRHLTKAENKHLVEAAEMEIERRWTRLKAMNDSPVL
jgi:pyruvate ferredoxin oxidoreductase alpha subunit